jgi:hypothetical protein
MQTTFSYQNRLKIYSWGGIFFCIAWIIVFAIYYGSLKKFFLNSLTGLFVLIFAYIRMILERDIYGFFNRVNIKIDENGIELIIKRFIFSEVKEKILFKNISDVTNVGFYSDYGIKIYFINDKGQDDVFKIYGLKEEYKFFAMFYDYFSRYSIINSEALNNAHIKLKKINLKLNNEKRFRILMKYILNFTVLLVLSMLGVKFNIFKLDSPDTLINYWFIIFICFMVFYYPIFNFPHDLD